MAEINVNMQMTTESDLSPQKIMGCMAGSWAGLFSSRPGIILLSDRPHLSLKRTKDVPRLTYSGGAPLTHSVSKSLTQGGLYIYIYVVVATLLHKADCHGPFFLKWYNMSTCSCVTARVNIGNQETYMTFTDLSWGPEYFPGPNWWGPRVTLFYDWKIYWVIYCTTNLLCLCWACAGNKTHH